MRNKIVIRCDGGPEIGLGHLIRSTALAQMLKQEFDIHFINKEIPEPVKQELLSLGFLQSTIVSEDDFFSQITKNDIVVLDHYDLTSDTQLKIKQNGNPLVCIDDLHNKVFYADLIINHAPGAKKTWYKAQEYTKYALGLPYVLLRPAFLEEAQKIKPSRKLEHLLICFGGADMHNFTFKSLKAACETKLFKEIHVIVGASYLAKSMLDEFVKQEDHILLYANIGEREIIQIMRNSDLAIVPSSGILFETLACGCEAIAGYYVDNQQEIYQGFKALNIIHPAEDFSNIESLLATSSTFALKNNHKIIDGLSGERLLKCFQDL